MFLEHAVLLTRNVHPFSSHLINSSCHPLRFNFLFSHLVCLTLLQPHGLGFPRQEYWGGLPFPFTGDLPDVGMKPTSPALQAIPYH